MIPVRPLGFSDITIIREFATPTRKRQVKALVREQVQEVLDKQPETMNLLHGTLYLTRSITFFSHIGGERRAFMTNVEPAPPVQHYAVSDELG